MVSYVLTRRRAEDKGLDTSEASRVALLTTMIPGNPALKIVLGDRLAEARAPDDDDDDDGADDKDPGDGVAGGSIDRGEIEKDFQAFLASDTASAALQAQVAPMVADRHQALVQQSLEPIETRLGQIEERLKALTETPAPSGGARAKRGGSPG